MYLEAVQKGIFLESKRRVRPGPIYRTGVPFAYDWYPQFGIQKVF